jgi:hypothetical protein
MQRIAGVGTEPALCAEGCQSRPENNRAERIGHEFGRNKNKTVSALNVELKGESNETTNFQFKEIPYQSDSGNNRESKSSEEL